MPFSPTSVMSPLGKRAKSGPRAHATLLSKRVQSLDWVLTFDYQVIESFVELVREQNILFDSGRHDPTRRWILGLGLMRNELAYQGFWGAYAIEPLTMT
jgi:hypothetical protein